jgi:(4S)-4-hydroxy-5-phosphonooxypentane-2,3-dione isomerase
MFVVLVDFIVKSGFEDRFKEALLVQAENSLTLEPDCHYFDVCIEGSDTKKFTLYELYTNSKAFDVHLQSEHFLTFNQLVSNWISMKSVRTLKRVKK